jgi:hypothetical protein
MVSTAAAVARLQPLAVVVVVDFRVVVVGGVVVVEVDFFFTVVVVVDADVELDSRLHVAGPTTPSAFKPFAVWKALTAVSVCAPNDPSAATLKPRATSAAWICFTPDPLSPRPTLALGLVTTRPATEVDDDAGPTLAMDVEGLAPRVDATTGGVVVDDAGTVGGTKATAVVDGNVSGRNVVDVLVPAEPPQPATTTAPATPSTTSRT